MVLVLFSLAASDTGPPQLQSSPRTRSALLAAGYRQKIQEEIQAPSRVVTMLPTSNSYAGDDSPCLLAFAMSSRLIPISDPFLGSVILQL
jgi:hypothetical protein